MLHRIYLYGFFSSFIYYITFGYCLWGMIWDLFTMSYQVDTINSTINDTYENNFDTNIPIQAENQNEICGKCDGKKKIICEEGWLSGCGGSGRRKCDRCNGKGIYREFIHVEDPCSRCHGRGEMRCNICKATGYVDCNKCRAKGKVLCAACHGNGKVKVYV